MCSCHMYHCYQVTKESNRKFIFSSLIFSSMMTLGSPPHIQRSGRNLSTLHLFAVCIRRVQISLHVLFRVSLKISFCFQIYTCKMAPKHGLFNKVRNDYLIPNIIRCNTVLNTKYSNIHCFEVILCVHILCYKNIISLNSLFVFILSFHYY